MVNPVLILAALGAGAYLLSKKSMPAGTAVMASQVADVTPGGIQQFKSDLADAILRSLPSQVYSYPSLDDPRYVEVKPVASGAPPALSDSAYGWIQRMNTSQTILATLYMATPTTAQRFLRAVNPGDEKLFANSGGMYAVLLYAGALASGAKAPGYPSAPAGVPGSNTLPPSQTPPDPQYTNITQLPQELQDDFNRLLAAVNPDPDELDAVADQLQAYGFPGPAAQLHAKAADLRANPPYPPPAFKPGVDVPDLPVAPSGVQTVSALVTSSNGVNLRPQPNTSQVPLVAIPYGETVSVLDANAAPPDSDAPQGWAQISWHGKTGYATKVAMQSSAFVSAAPGSSVVPAPIAKTVTVTSSNGVNLRSQPSAKAVPPLAAIPFGQTVTVLNSMAAPADSDAPQGWAQISWNGKSGFATKVAFSAMSVSGYGRRKR